MKKFGILPKILIAIALGIVCSFFFPGWAVRVFLTFNSIFSNFLGMFIPLLIIGLVAPGIADLGKGAGKLLLITVVLAYSSTVLSGAFSYFSCKLAYPHILGNGLSALSNMDMSNVSFAGATFNNYVKLNNCNIQGADFSSAINLNISNINSTQSYLDKNLSGVKFANLDLSNWAFREQNLQNASFANSTLTNANMRFSDLRGADLSEAIDINTIKLTNTIWHDGVIKMFSMESDEDSFSIKRYALSSENQLSISAKITEDDAIISGGAILTLETGAELEVIDDGILTIASDGNLVINTDEVGSTLFAIADGAGLTFESGAILRINIEGTFVETDGDVIVLMSWTDDSNISGVNIFTIDENLFLTVNGEAYSGDWNYRIADNQFQVFFGQIPEPAFYAAVFGIAVLAFAARRREAK